MGKDPKSTPQSRTAERSALASSGRDVHDAATRVADEGAAALGAVVGPLLAPFLYRDDGWLRVTPKEDGETVYWKWKFTGGKHVNHYVMAVYPASQSAEALRRLAVKLHAVDCGIEAPVKDHYFKG